MNGKLTAVLLASALCVPSLTLAQQTTELGKYEYRSKCASCHGLSGKSHGSVSRFLVKPPSDLKTFAKRNGGAFPTQLAWQVIDGRPATAIGAHGTREMPSSGGSSTARKSCALAARKVQARVVCCGTGFCAGRLSGGYPGQAKAAETT